MSSSTSLGIICGSLGIIVVLAVVIAIAVQNSRQRKSIPSSTISIEPLQPASAVVIEPAPVSQSVAIPQPEGIPPAEQAVAESEELVDDKPLLSTEIVQYLKDLPPVQAEIAKKELKGSRVEWTLFFSSLMLKAYGKVEVTLLNEGNAYPAVSFITDYDRYPELKNPKWGMPVTVKGTIESVYSMYFVLTDIELAFPQ